jgi:hypothetical protein
MQAMSHAEFARILSTLDVLSPDQVRQLAHELQSRMVGPPAISEPSTDLTEEERVDQEAQRQLFDAGLISEIRPPLRDLTPYRNRKPVPIQGEPLSETVIRERR